LNCAWFTDRREIRLVDAILTRLVDEPVAVSNRRAYGDFSLAPRTDIKDHAIMMLFIELLGSPDRLRECLINDGWKLEDLREGNLRATHSQVPDQVAARRRLCKLGLLTSASLRIEFPPWLNSVEGGYRLEGVPVAPSSASNLHTHFSVA
jgi:hypothetical protein